MSDTTISSERRGPGRPRHGSTDVNAHAALIRATIEIIATRGSTDTSAKSVADAAGVTVPAVNYNFGSWNGLIAEAACVVYVEFVEQLWRAVQQAELNPEARLRAYMKAQLNWALHMSGWGAIFNYPFSAKRASEILRDKFGETMIAHFELNQARLEQLTIDVREDRVTPFDFGAHDFPRGELLKDQLAVSRSTMVGWTSLGMMVWAGRGLTLEAQIPEILEMQDGIREFTIEQSIKAIRSDKA